MAGGIQFDVEHCNPQWVLHSRSPPSHRGATAEASFTANVSERGAFLVSRPLGSKDGCGAATEVWHESRHQRCGEAARRPCRVPCLEPHILDASTIAGQAIEAVE